MKHVPFKDPFPIGFQAEFPYAQTGSHEKTTTTTPYRIARPEGIPMVWPFVGNVNALWQVHHTTLQPNPCTHAISIIADNKVISSAINYNFPWSTPPEHGGFEDELPLWKGMTVHIPAVFGAGKYLKIPQSPTWEKISKSHPQLLLLSQLKTYLPEKTTKNTKKNTFMTPTFAFGKKKSIYLGSGLSVPHLPLPSFVAFFFGGEMSGETSSLWKSVRKICFFC